jgi:hypothetical protein
MKKILKLSLVLFLITSCSETIYMQRMAKEDSGTYAIGPAIKIKISKFQFNKIMKKEVYHYLRDSNTYPCKIEYINNFTLKDGEFLGPNKTPKWWIEK